ncbi:MAG: hypothetical protein NT121_12350 [Chloroflexi bacterium]|nr:hypothetical protein [Chloroflexota bacterium]
MNTTTFFIDAVGWTGAALVLIAYGLLSIRWMDGNSYSYQALNVTGAIMLVINSYYLKAYPSVGVNAAWVGIAVLTLFREWWRGPAETYKRVTARLSKREPLRKISLQRIKLPAFKLGNRNNQKKPRTSAKEMGQPQFL